MCGASINGARNKNAARCGSAVSGLTAEVATSVHILRGGGAGGARACNAGHSQCGQAWQWHAQQQSKQPSSEPQSEEARSEHTVNTCRLCGRIVLAWADRAKHALDDGK